MRNGIIGSQRNNLKSEQGAIDRLYHYVEAIWAVSTSELALSFAELQDASHWVPESAELIKPASDDLSRELLEDMDCTAREAGVSDTRPLATSLLLMISAMRSLVIAMRLNEGDELLSTILETCKQDWREKVRSALENS